MKAVAIRPRAPGTLHLRDLPKASLDEVPGGRGARMAVLSVGLCATDRDLVAGHYGTAPAGADHLVIGHECLGRVIELGPATAPDLRPGQLVVPTIRRPAESPYDRAGRPDLSSADELIERGISRRHGYLAEEFVESSDELVPVPEGLAGIGVLTEPMACVRKGLRQADEIGARLGIWEPRRSLVLGAGPIGLLAVLQLRLRGSEVFCYARRPVPNPDSELVQRIGGRYVSAAEAEPERLGADRPFDLVVEATGAASMVFPAVRALAPNGILVLLSVTPEPTPVEVDAAGFNQSLVLRNRAIVGSVAAAREDFAAAVQLLSQAQEDGAFSGWLPLLITTRLEGFDLRAIERQLSGEDDGGIKAVVDVWPPIRDLTPLVSRG